MTRVARDPSRPVTSLELVCPAGTPAALRTAVDAGAHTVYCGFRDETNARNFPGLNFSREELRAGVDYAAIIGADAVIIADIGLVLYEQMYQPQIRRHLSVQAAASKP